MVAKNCVIYLSVNALLLHHNYPFQGVPAQERSGLSPDSHPCQELDDNPDMMPPIVSS